MQQMMDIVKALRERADEVFGQLQKDKLEFNEQVKNELQEVGDTK